LHAVPITSRTVTPAVTSFGNVPP